MKRDFVIIMEIKSSRMIRGPRHDLRRFRIKTTVRVNHPIKREPSYEVST